ncbi:Mitochondrial transcription termination factor, mTERF [Handroanthus impetiginosus]|uniref:Mitochondrial transcription termination factor, mTERF n=1 Tax=Handroanthus impetiginosus TaxID=429701 RepID=A0A2G9HKG1_9LAMI|nr:Mitochondrial transcription termination factor, mTERF [Handroanthus impetiginosus]
MSNSFYIHFIRIKFSPTHKPCCLLQLTPFSSATTATQKPISKIANQNSFAVDYLINTLGFSPERAFSASKYLKFKSREKPDSVIAFLKKHGFTKQQIERLVKYYPHIILRNPQKAMLPKIEFFQSLGISKTEITQIFTTAPEISGRSLERQIIPCFGYIKSLFDANGTSLSYLKFAPEALCCNLQSRLLPNVNVLKESGVPYSKIVYLLQTHPRTVMIDAKGFRKLVEKVKEMGFNPLASTFVIAVHVLRVMNKSNWEKMVAAYKKWGISDNEIITAFAKHPHFITSSTDKIMAVMDFFVNKIGMDPSVVVKAPALVSYSLDKRIKPRYSVYKILAEKGLIKKGSCLVYLFKCGEKFFLERFVKSYEEKAPQLPELYQKELAISEKASMK